MDSEELTNNTEEQQPTAEQQPTVEQESEDTEGIDIEEGSDPSEEDDSDDEDIFDDEDSDDTSDSDDSDYDDSDDYSDEDGEITDDEDEDGYGEDEDSDSDAGSDKEPEQSKPEQPKEDVKQPQPVSEQTPLEFGDKRIKPTFIPGSREFVTDVMAEAKAEAAKAMGVEEYDPYDTEHQAWFQQKYAEISSFRTQCYNLAVNEIKQQKAQAESKKALSAQLAQILNTPEKQKAMNDALEGSSYRFYRKLQEEVRAGNSDNLIRLAKQVAKKYKSPVERTPHQRSERPRQKSEHRPKKDRGYASDLVFGGRDRW